MTAIVRETCSCCSGLGYFPDDVIGESGSCSFCLGLGYLEYSSLFKKEVPSLPVCYECLKPVLWLAPDGRCKSCTRCTPEDITGGAL